MFNLNLSQQPINLQAKQICKILQEAGFQSFIVGGCVRDLILGFIPKDYDITTDATPQQIMDLFPKTIPTGLQHGTVTIVMGEGIQNHFEITTFRVESDYKDGRRPEEVFFVKNIVQDLARRDLTINAIAYDPINNQLIDPFGGILDLHKKEIKAVGNPIDRFMEDGLRIMRAARFASRFGYFIEKETFIAMSKCLSTFEKISKERIKDELCKILLTTNPKAGLVALECIGALSLICPFLTSLPIYMAMISIQNICEGDLETRVAFMYSNCGKLKEIEQELINLKFSNKEVKQICFLLDLNQRLTTLSKNWSQSSYKEFIAHIKNQMGDDWEYTMKEFIKLIKPFGFSHKEEFLRYHEINVLSKKEMNINGNDLLQMGIKAGPQIKIILNLCYEEILHNPNNNTKEHLLNFVNHLTNSDMVVAH